MSGTTPNSFMADCLRKRSKKDIALAASAQPGTASKGSAGRASSDGSRSSIITLMPIN